MATEWLNILGLLHGAGERKGLVSAIVWPIIPCKTNMHFQVAAREVERIIVVDVAGRLTLNDSRTQLRDLVHVFISNGHKKFLINLEGVDFVDSNGLGELTRCFCTVRQAGGDMKLVHVNARVQALLEMTRINKLFEIHTEEYVALEAFRGASARSIPAVKEW